MFASPGDIAFSIGSLPIYYYGIIMAASISLGIFTANLIAKKYYPEINAEVIYDISPYLIIGAIIGARLYYCLLSFKYFITNPLEIIQLWHGGISIHGAILGGLIAGIIYAKRNKLPILKLCDIFSYGLILGQALGRWGNFFNSEAFGRPTENFLKLYIPIYKRPLQYLQCDYFHPTFLYESILDICIFLILFFIIRKITSHLFTFSPSHPKITSNVTLNSIQGRICELPCDAESTSQAKAVAVNFDSVSATAYVSSARRDDGIIFFSYLILYSIARIIIEQVRIDSVLNIFGVPIAQVVSVIIILIASFGIFRLIRNKNVKY